MEKEQQVKQNAVHKFIHLFASNEELSLSNGGQIKKEKILSVGITQDHIIKIYKFFRQEISKLKNGENKTGQKKYFLIFYQKRALLFYKFYNRETIVRQVKDKSYMFDVCQLNKLFSLTQEILTYLKGDIKISKSNKRLPRIKLKLLIFDIESLQEEIYNAAYPSQRSIDQLVLSHQDLCFMNDFKNQISRFNNYFKVEQKDSDHTDRLFNLIQSYLQDEKDPIKQIQFKSIRMKCQLDFIWAYYCPHGKLSINKLLSFLKKISNMNQLALHESDYERIFQYSHYALQFLLKKQQKSQIELRECLIIMLNLILRYENKFKPQSKSSKTICLMSIICICSKIDQNLLTSQERDYQLLSECWRLNFNQICRQKKQLIPSIINFDQNFTSKIMCKVNLIEQLKKYLQIQQLYTILSGKQDNK